MQSNRRERGNNSSYSNSAKTKFDLQVRGGTVVMVAHDQIVILGADHLMYRIDTQSQREFANLDLSEGETVWIYCVPQRFRVLTILKQSDQPECPGEVNRVVEL